MAKVREYKVKNLIPLSESIKRGEYITHETYQSLGVFQVRVDVREFDVPDELLEQQLSQYPHLHVIKNPIQKVIDKVLPKKAEKLKEESVDDSSEDKSEINLIDSIKDKIKSFGGKLPRGKSANDPEALQKALEEAQEDQKTEE